MQHCSLQKEFKKVFQPKKKASVPEARQFTTEEDFFAQEENKESRFNLMIKADSEGVLDAVDVAISRISVPGVKLNILHKENGFLLWWR